MLKLEYPCRLTAEDDGTFTVSFPDVPEALTCGGTRGEALELAQDALSVALTFYLEDGRPTPKPGRRKAGEVLVSPDLQIALKAAVARKLACQPKATSNWPPISGATAGVTPSAMPR